MREPCSPMGSLDFWYIWAGGAYVTGPRETPRRWVSNELLSQMVFHARCHDTSLEEFSVSCVTQWVEDSGKLFLGFL